MIPAPLRLLATALVSTLKSTPSIIISYTIILLSIEYITLALMPVSIEEHYKSSSHLQRSTWMGLVQRVHSANKILSSNSLVGCLNIWPQRNQLNVIHTFWNLYLIVGRKLDASVLCLVFQGMPACVVMRMSLGYFSIFCWDTQVSQELVEQ